MKYFRLTQDHRIPYGIMIQNFRGFPNIQEAINGNIIPLKFMSVGFVKPSQYNWYPEVLDSQRVFMVQEDVKKVFSLYLPDAEYRHFCILDKANMVYKYYYVPQLDLIDCLSNESKSNLDKSVFDKIVLKKEEIVSRDIFRVSNINTTMVIVSLAVAESLLRRDVFGIRLFNVQLV